MKEWRTHKIVVALIAAAANLAAFLTAPSADARPWKSTPTMLAQDYGQIIDSRPNNQLVMLWWLPAPMEKSKAGQEILDKYVVIGIADAQVSNEGVFSFSPIPTLSATVSGAPLHLLTATDTPPSVAGFLTIMQTGMTRAAGQIGAGLHWFAFDAGAFRACGSSGELAIPYAGEVYTYDAPIPGCPK